MKIDLETNKVTLEPGETLDYQKILFMAAGYQARTNITEGFTIVFGPEAEPTVTVLRDWAVRGTKVYTVVLLSTGVYACSCPDFQYRRSHETGDFCKHIIRVISGWA